MSWRIAAEPLLRPIFHTWWRLRRPTTLGVRILVCDSDGRILLVRHSYARGWHLPGGGVEPGETAPAAARRELAEEGGVEAIGALTLLGFYANHAVFPNDHVALYQAESWRPCPPRANGEIVEHGFFARDALPKGVTGGTLRRLAEVFDAAPLSATW